MKLFTTHLATALLMVVSLIAVPTDAATPPTSIRQQIEMEQKLGAVISPELTFRDETGKSRSLQHYFGETPIILHLAYIRCPMLCNVTRDGLLDALQMMNLQPGADFQILTVSFDPREGPNLASEARQTAIRRYDRPGAADAWHFLTGDPSSIDELTQTVGFKYAWDEAREQYAHGAGIIILTPDGHVSRYLNGVDFSPRDLRLALVEASDNQIGTPTDQVLLMCYQYDPTTGRYGLQITTALRVGGGLTVLGLVVGIGLLLHRERRKPAHTEQAVSLERRGQGATE